MALYLQPQTLSTTLTFAEQAAAAEFGRHYVPPADRNFQDRPPPNWQPLGEVTGRVVSQLERRRGARARERRNRPRRGAKVAA